VLEERPELVRKEGLFSFCYPANLDFCAISSLQKFLSTNTTFLQTKYPTLVPRFPQIFSLFFFSFPGSKYVFLSPQLEKLIEKNYYLNRSAREGYRSYLQAYASHSLKNIFNVNKLDLQLVAKGFGFSVPPKVNLSIFSFSSSSSIRLARVHKLGLP